MTQKISLTLDYRVNFEHHFRENFPEIAEWRIISQSLDARGAPKGLIPKFHYQVEGRKTGEQFEILTEPFPQLGPLPQRPIIIGAGSAGLFCALRLSEYGIPCLLLERGSVAPKRMSEIARYWRYGELNPENNVCFGEGGAGLFSDGKLITRIKSPFIPYVMNRLVDFGAPPETAYVSNPHLGSNKIRKIITQISAYLKSKGTEIVYQARVQNILWEKNKAVGVQLNNGQKYLSDTVVLATGHSAHDMYEHLNNSGVSLKAKDFALGVRIEHPRDYIDSWQHGKFADDTLLGAARYRVSHNNEQSGRGTYSFCMCPGGYVLSSGTEADGIVVNGMSNYARNAPWSNSALVVTVKAGLDFALKPQNVLDGLSYQRAIETKAYQYSKERASGKEVPALSVEEFLQGQLNSLPLPPSSCPSHAVKAEIYNILPTHIVQHLREALKQFERKSKGFAYGKALLLAPETRTSAPVTVVRDPESLESLSHSGLYPCGEGAGYAGGITSAACDGIKVAMAILKKHKQYEVPQHGSTN